MGLRLRTGAGGRRFESADGAILTCGSQSGALSQSDVRSSLVHPAIYTVALAPGQDTTTITAAPGERWRLAAIYASVYADQLLGPRTITVYDSDGKTAIGRFVLSQGRSVVTGTSHSATIGGKPTSGAQTAP